MAELKTRPEKASVTAFIAKIADTTRRKDSTALVKLMSTATGAKPKMWGTSIIGFGLTRLRYASGRELDWPMIAFSPRKSAIVVYNLVGLDLFEKVSAKLGEHTTGKGCLYLKRLDDVDLAVLKRLIDVAVKAKASQRVD